MLTRALFVLSIVGIWCVPAAAQTLDTSTVQLTAAGADKFVRATQELVKANAAPGGQRGGNNAMQDWGAVKAQLDGNPAAQKALAAGGVTSTDYVLFMGAAMQALMVGQMELAGMKGMLPPGVKARPSQANIDFMKTNTDLFQRAMTLGTPAPNSTAARLAAAQNDVAQPMPAAAGAVLPSSLIAKLPPLSSITAGTDCSLGDLQGQIKREHDAAAALEAAYYGNPGDNGLARTPAEGKMLERAGDTELIQCGSLMNFTNVPGMAAAEQEFDRARGEISKEQSEGWNKCPGIPGGKEPACERAVEARAAQQLDAAQRKYLQAASQPFAGLVSQIQACEQKREAIVKDAKAADVRGANVKQMLRPLVAAWELAPFVTSQWTGICENAQRYLIKR
jgi:hypothetical protein